MLFLCVKVDSVLCVFLFSLKFDKNFANFLKKVKIFTNLMKILKFEVKIMKILALNLGLSLVVQGYA